MRFHFSLFVALIFFSLTTHAIVGRTQSTMKITLKDTVELDTCLNKFEQVNEAEPLAICSIPVPGELNSLVKPIAIWPIPAHDTFDTHIGNIGCTGGIEGNEHSGIFNVFVNLSPYRRDYSRQDFEACFSFIAGQLKKDGQALYLKITK